FGTARRVIMLFMEGAPSQFDTFDYKPNLGRGGTMRSPFEFVESGQSGLPISEVFPSLAEHADHLCLLNAMETSSSSHSAAETQLHTGGNSMLDTPSLGSWAFYGHGPTAQQLPGYVTVNYPGESKNFGAGFLPAKYQGVKMEIGSSKRAYFGETDSVVPNALNRHYTRGGQARQLDLVQQMNRAFADELGGDDRIEAVIESIDQGFILQDSFRELVDTSNVAEETQQLYGIDQPATSDFGQQCLLARRLAESDVRFIQLSHDGWDHHSNIEEKLAEKAGEVDKPIAGLLTDLERRGLLEETLVVWGGEFGRTAKGSGGGRDHQNRGYSMWMAGSGVRGGMRFGETDELGKEIVDGRVGMEDLHATILHLLGFDPKRLDFKRSESEQLLGSAAEGRVVSEILV
ncbi:MAG: hypothetical protein ACI8UO_001041, partial [Verrucomicrobiales bacterium]